MDQRYVLVPGWTDEPESVEGIARFVAGLGAVDRVDVLPFHKRGATKYEVLGLPFPLRAPSGPDADLIERVRERFRTHGVPACRSSRCRPAPRRASEAQQAS